MSLYGTCQKCGSETIDYACADCNRQIAFSLEAECERLRADNATLRAVLKDIEDCDGGYCPVCQNLPEECHAADCRLAAVLAGKDGER